MITGYNTDVRHRGVVFHVQTEDKGLEKACIESLVYVGGQIVDRKRSGYQALIENGGGKGAVLELVEKQHREMIAQIRTGQMDGQVESELGPLEPGAPAPVPDAVPADSATASLDQVILDYLSSEADQDHLILVMDAEQEPRLGSETTLSFLTKTSNAGRPVPDTAISVRLISTTSEPSILARGATGPEGKLKLRIRIPPMPRGSAALIVTGTSEVGTAEIKPLL